MNNIVKRYYDMKNKGGDGSDYVAYGDAMAEEIERLDKKADILEQLYHITSTTLHKLEDYLMRGIRVNTCNCGNCESEDE